MRKLYSSTVLVRVLIVCCCASRRVIDSDVDGTFLAFRSSSKGINGSYWLSISI